MWFGVLGPLEVRSATGETITVGGPRPRALLVLLLTNAGRVVGMEQLIAGQYGENPPAGAADAVQAQVSRLRRVLPGDLIEFHGGGYRLAARTEDVDARRFERLSAEGTADRRLPGRGLADSRTHVPGPGGRRVLPRLDQPGRHGPLLRGRVALLGDAAYGNTLGGFGTGLAVVGAYVLAGELRAADGDHRTAFQRYEEGFRGYARISRQGGAGPFLAPHSRIRMRMRNLMFQSPLLLRALLKMTDRFATGIDLKEY